MTTLPAANSSSYEYCTAKTEVIAALGHASSSSTTPAAIPEKPHAKNSAKHTAGISSMRIPITDKMRRSQSICARLLPAIIIPVIIMESGVFIFPISASGCSITSGTGIWHR